MACRVHKIQAFILFLIPKPLPQKGGFPYKIACYYAHVTIADTNCIKTVHLISVFLHNHLFFNRFFFGTVLYIRDTG